MRNIHRYRLRELDTFAIEMKVGIEDPKILEEIKKVRVRYWDILDRNYSDEEIQSIITESWEDLWLIFRAI